MATSSFDRSFIVNDPETIKQVKYNLDNPTKVVYSKRDLKKEAAEGIAILKQRLSRSAS